MPSRRIFVMYGASAGLFVAACALVLAGCAPDAGSASRAAPPSAQPADTAAFRAPGTVYRADSIRAVTLDARRAPRPAVLDTLRALGATHLALVPFGFMEESSQPVLEMNTDARWYSEGDAGIRALARQAQQRGLGLILKPHVWVGHYSSEGQSRDQIRFATEADWQQWERQYRRFMLHYARLAEATGADVLVIGTELEGIVAGRPGLWRRLIADVRAVYGGELTYAANWYEGYENVPFWDLLDYVGVQAYFPLSDAEDPSLSALRAGWQAHCEALRRISEETGRPVLLTEIGYRSVGYAAETPWRWPAREEAAPADDALQARLYRAFFERVWPEPWLAGAIVWKWHPEAGERHRTRFTPQGKPAAEALRRGFGGS